MAASKTLDHQRVAIPAGQAALAGEMSLPADATTIVLFAHGSGSSHSSQRNRTVAEALHASGMGTLLFDLLTTEEQETDARTRTLRFDIGLLTSRLNEAVDWTLTQPTTRDLPLGLFGASTGAAAALGTAAARSGVVKAVVSRGGRPDLAHATLPKVAAPTLLIVGGNDTEVIGFNRQAAERLSCDHRVEVIPDAGHLFAEPGKLKLVAELTEDWFRQHLTGSA